MPKDPKRNLQRYQIQGGHLNEFEFQKSQSELADDSDLRFTDQRGEPDLSQAERVAAVTADAHRKVEKRKQPSTAKAAGAQNIAPGKSSPRKVARKSAGKTGIRTAAKKRSDKTAAGKGHPRR